MSSFASSTGRQAVAVGRKEVLQAVIPAADSDATRINALFDSAERQPSVDAPLGWPILTSKYFFLACLPWQVVQYLSIITTN